MSLTVSRDIGLSALAANAERTAIVSRNVAASGDPAATRKQALVTTDFAGGVRVGGIGRAADQALLDNLIDSLSALGRREVEKASLDQIEAVLGNADLGQSPTALLGELRDRLQVFASAPNDVVRAQAVIHAAEDVVHQLNTLAGTVETVRGEVNAALSQSVADVNELLAQFEAVNAEIVRGTTFNKDITSLLDRRDQILKGLAENFEIRTVSRASNDMVIYAGGGITLFERVPRAVHLAPANGTASGLSDHAVFVDGVAITGNGPMSASQGRIVGLVHVRDVIAPTFARQLDEIARGLITAFRETDQSPVPGSPDLPGLFTFTGAASIPAAGLAVDGLAKSISLNANVDPARGGDVFRLRDGQISDPLNPAYLYNPTGQAGFVDRINELILRFDEPMTFDGSAALTTSSGLLGYAAASEGWFQATRASITQDHEYGRILVDRSTESLSKVVGVNLDEELTELLELERSYQASSRLLKVVEDMYRTLLAATG